MSRATIPSPRKRSNQASKTMYKCQGPACKTKNQGCLVFFTTEDGVGHTRALCSSCWTEHNGAVGSTRTFWLEQAPRRQRGGLQHNPFGDGRITHLMCRRYVKATKELRAELKRRKEAVFGSGTSDLEGLQADVEALWHCREDGTVEVHKWITELPYHALRGLAQACKGRRWWSFL